MSSTNGSSGFDVGAAKTMGLVPRRRRPPPNGATSSPPPWRFTQAIVTMPAAAACSPYAPMRPAWPPRCATATEMPCSRAFSMVMSIVKPATTWP